MRTFERWWSMPSCCEGAMTSVDTDHLSAFDHWLAASRKQKKERRESDRSREREREKESNHFYSNMETSRIRHMFFQHLPEFLRKSKTDWDTSMDRTALPLFLELSHQGHYFSQVRSVCSVSYVNEQVFFLNRTSIVNCQYLLRQQIFLTMTKNTWSMTQMDAYYSCSWRNPTFPCSTLAVIHSFSTTTTTSCPFHLVEHWTQTSIATVRPTFVLTPRSLLIDRQCFSPMISARHKPVRCSDGKDWNY